MYLINISGYTQVSKDVLYHTCSRNQVERKSSTSIILLSR